MAPLQSRNIVDLIAELDKRVEQLQSALARGPILPSYASTTLPANPPTGLEVLVTDLGLKAYWNGTAWVYPSGQLLYQTVLAAPASSVRLPGSGSLPQMFTNLRIIIDVKTDGGGTNGFDSIGMRFNGVSTSSYGAASYWLTQGTSSLAATTSTPVTSMPVANSWNAHFGTAGRGTATIDVPNYSGVTNYKAFTSTSTAADGGTAGILQNFAGTYNGTSAITSVTLLPAGNFVADSTFSVYGF